MIKLLGFRVWRQPFRRHAKWIAEAVPTRETAQNSANIHHGIKPVWQTTPADPAPFPENWH